jgi:5,5'-dehydrodivanillate O-demethylase
MNERLTQVGPGTPCGELMRRYWIPIGPSAQLLENPVRKVRFLGEDLVLYRNTSGTYGLIGDRCLHRRVDLQFGIPDERGLRCPYHGWLYAETGACLERPLEAQPSREIDRKLPGYPVRELTGMLFAYMGPQPVPDLPRWDLYVWPNAIRQIAVNVLDCNWLQCQENTGDPVHSVWAHARMFQYHLERRGELERTNDADHTIHMRLKMGVGIKDLYAEATEYGFKKGVVYSKELGADRDYVSQHSTVIFPFYTQTGGPGTARSEYQIRVPIDDTHTYHLCYQVYAAPPGITVPSQDVIPWYEAPTVDEFGQPILDYVLAQDAIVWTAQGGVVDRSAELLGRTDIPIVFLRRQLEEQIALVEAGQTPMNVFPTSPDILYGQGHPPEGVDRERVLKLGYRQMYHKGYGTDDVDRYGPAIELVKDLHRRIEEAQLAAPDQVSA